MSEEVKRPDLEDIELGRRAKSGDLAAYEELVRRYQEVSFRAAWLITRDASEAEDAVQEAFVKAYRALSRFHDGAPFKPWLLRIVTNEAKNRRKAAARRTGLELRIRAETPHLCDDGPESSILERESRESVLAGLGALRPKDREVIYYRYFLDLSESETATALGCRRGTVKSRLSRALARLREKFGERDA